MRSIAPTALRRLVIEDQGFAGRQRNASPTEVEAVIRRLSCVQLDSISTVERSHRIAISSRSGRFAADTVTRLLQTGRIFEYWAHEARSEERRVGKECRL